MAAVLLTNLLIGETFDSGDLLYVYEIDTTTPVTTYSDYDLTTAQTHPVVADASGRFAAIYLDASDGAVDVKVEDSDNVEKYTATFPVSDLTSTTTQVTANSTSISALTGRVTTLESQSDTNTTDIATNAAAITALETAPFVSGLVFFDKSTSSSPSFAVTYPTTGAYLVEAHLNLYSVSRTVEGSQVYTLKSGLDTIDSITVPKEGDSASAHLDYEYASPMLGQSYGATSGAATVTVTTSGDAVFDIRECYVKVTRFSE